MLLVTVVTAKHHLQVIDNEHDQDIYRKIEAASAIVEKHIKGIPDSWVHDFNASPIRYDVPADVQTEILLILGELYYARESSVFNIQESLNRLSHYRQPTFA